MRAEGDDRRTGTGRGAYSRCRVFCQSRAVDFAWPELRVGVEIDGFGYGHQAQQHMATVNEKQNEAVELGWTILRFNSRQLGSHGATEEAVRQVCRVLMSRHEVTG